MFRKLLYIFISLNLLVSCNQKENKSNRTVISGQIVNPIGEYVLLSHSEKKTDTLHLDKQGFFKYSFNQKSEGLFRIKHGELQYIYIVPGDSIVFRINTLEFDETLAFSGNSADKNNFLINQFLKNEDFNTTLPELFKLKPAAFEKHINEQRALNNKELKNFSKKKKSSKGFLAIAQANIDYNFYSQKELYTSNHHTDEYFTYPSGFYDYRNTINFDDKSLSNYYAYYSFLNRYFDNITYEKYKATSQYERESFIHNKTKLEMIDSAISNKYLHNHMLRSTVKRYLLNADNSDEEARIITLFYSLDKNSTDQEYIREYAEKSAKINAGNLTPNLILVNLNNESVLLHDLTKQLTVLYFWSRKNIKHIKEIHARVAELKSKYPEYNFIGINTGSNFKDWKKIVTNSGYDSKSEFQFENSQKAINELLINSSNKVIILDKNGVILEGNSHIFNQNFEGKLLGFINK